MRFCGTRRGAQPDAFWQEICRKKNLGRQRSQKKSISKPCGKASDKKQPSLPKRTKMQTKLENKEPDVRFIPEALIGSLMGWTAEGDLLLEDQTSRVAQEQTCAAASPIGSCLSKIHQAKSYMFPDSLLCVRTHDKSKATAHFFF